MEERERGERGKRERAIWKAISREQKSRTEKGRMSKKLGTFKIRISVCNAFLFPRGHRHNIIKLL